MELWSAKYRPKTFDELILPDAFKTRLNNYVITGNLNHCLFYGNSGTGKTSTALVIKNYFIKDESDCLILNASNDRGIDTIRGVVLDFMKVPPFEGKIKLVIMDESDSVTPDAWKALRSPIENPEDNLGLSTRFIFTANFESKIPDFIKSRCDCYEFNDVPHESILSKCIGIMNKEHVQYDEEDIQATINDLYPDMRSIINTLQKNSIDGSYSYSMDRNISKEIFDMTLNVFKNYTDVKTVSEGLFMLRNLVVPVNYQYLAKSLMNEDIPIEILPVINHYLNSFPVAVDPRSHYMSMIGDSILMLRSFGNGQ